MTARSPCVQALGDHVMDCMDSILTHFKPGAKITVVVRQSDYPDGSRDMVVTDDDILAVIHALEIRRKADG